MSKDDEVKFSAMILDERPKATELQLDDGNSQWVPNVFLMHYPGGKFSVPKWFADQEGMDYDRL